MSHKIAITTNGSTLDAEVAPRFGSCNYFIIADLDDMAFEVVGNPGVTTYGNGIGRVHLLLGKGIRAVLTGSCGYSAQRLLSGSGVEIIAGVSGTAQDAVKDYLSGRLYGGPKSVPVVGSRCRRDCADSKGMGCALSCHECNKAGCFTGCGGGTEAEMITRAMSNCK